MNATIAVPSSAALFEGHFPGQPILPGVTQLVLILEALARETRGPVALRAIANVRLRQLVLPGDRLELARREREGGRLRFDLRRDGVAVANGELILGRPEQPETAPSFGAGTARTGAPTLDALLPHRAPMRFVTSILRETLDGLVCEARIPTECPLVSDGSVAALVALEAAAQSAAAWEALRRWQEGGTAVPRVGYLVALRDIVLFAERIRAGETLLTRVHLEAAALPLTYYRISVSSGGTLVLRGTIATFLAQADDAIPFSTGGVDRSAAADVG